jgi:hypothetical protein
MEGAEDSTVREATGQRISPGESMAATECDSVAELAAAADGPSEGTAVMRALFAEGQS